MHRAVTRRLKLVRFVPMVPEREAITEALGPTTDAIELARRAISGPAPCWWCGHRCAAMGQVLL